MSALPTEVVDALVRLGVVPAGTVPAGEPLTGGVSSDIHRVDTPTGPVCVKRALARLKVAAVWEAPVERNRYERAWLELAAEVVPDNVPAVLAHDDEAGLFVMPYLDPVDHPVWKAELRDGRVDGGFAGAVGDVLGAIHAATADDDEVAEAFPTAALFDALRLEPYLGSTARAHPDLAAVLGTLRARTAATRRVLVHGDVSPKNVLCGPAGPVLLDAECATFGDPAFDVAFCANHLVLKGRWRPEHRRDHLRALDAFVSAYRHHVGWEPVADVERRAAELLPALLLARVDGTSPVEYLDDAGRADVRAFAVELLRGEPPTTIGAVSEAWGARRWTT